MFKGARGQSGCTRFGAPILPKDGETHLGRRWVCAPALDYTHFVRTLVCGAFQMKSKVAPIFLHLSLLEMGAQLYFNWKKGLHPFWANMGGGCVSLVSNWFFIRRTSESSPHVFVCGFCSPHGTGCSEDGLTVLCSVHVGSSCVCTKNNHKQTNAMSFYHPLSPFAENP